MALHWSLEGIKDNESRCWIETGEKDDNGNLKLGSDGKPEARMNPVTEALIFGCMFVGLHGITEDNVGKFAARLDLVQRLNGNLLVKDGESVPVSDEAVFAHIGLQCNVSDESDAAWIKRQVDMKRLIAQKQRKLDESRERVEA